MKFEELLYKYRFQAITLLAGVILFCYGIATLNYDGSENSLMVTEDSKENSEKIVVEISGAVASPGVYEMSSTARIDDLIKEAGGFSNENKDWVAKIINRAAVLKDGQKIYIPGAGEPANAVGKQTNTDSANNFGGSQSGSAGVLSTNSSIININTASQSELESLPGIGPVYAQKIIEQRPYSDTNELTSKNVLGSSLFEKIENFISVY